MSAPASLAWFAQNLRLGLRHRRLWATAALGATVVVFGRALDLFAFTPEPLRALSIGLETGTLFGVLFVAVGGDDLAGLRDPDDGWSHNIRASRLGTSAAWWGAYAARWTQALGLLFLCMLTTLVFSAYMSEPVALPAPRLATAVLALTVAALAGGAASLWVGPAIGGVVGALTWGIGAVAPTPGWAALGAPLAGSAAGPTEWLRAVLVTLAAGGFAQAGLARLGACR